MEEKNRYANWQKWGENIVDFFDSHGFMTGVGIDVPFWGLVSHHQNKYLLEITSPRVGRCETLGHLPTPV